MIKIYGNKMSFSVQNYKIYALAFVFMCGVTMLDTPVPIKSLKLSNIGCCSMDV